MVRSLIQRTPGPLFVAFFALWVAACASPSNEESAVISEEGLKKEDFVKACMSDPAPALCTLSPNEAIAPTRYPLVIVPGSGGLYTTLYHLVRGMGAKCGKCRAWVDPKVALKYDLALNSYCDFPRDMTPKGEHVESPYAYCCGNGGDQHIYIPKLQGFQPSEKRVQCLAVHLMRARDIFGPEPGKQSPEDQNQDGLADYVNLIGHSMGGVDAALAAKGPHAIPELFETGLTTGDNKILSITTLAAPLGGASSASEILKMLEAPPLKAITVKAIKDIKESALHEAIATYFAARSTPDFQKNKDTSVIAWLRQMSQPHAEVIDATRLNKGVFYQSFAGFAVPSPGFYKGLAARFLLFGNGCGPLPPEYNAPGLKTDEQRRIWYTQNLLADVESTSGGHYAYPIAPRDLGLRNIDLSPSSSWLHRLPTFWDSDAALWVYGFRQVGSDGHRMIRAGDGIVPLSGAVVGDPVNFYVGDIAALKSAVTKPVYDASEPVDFEAGVIDAHPRTIERGKWWFRGVVPGDHDGISGGENSLAGTVWHDDIPQTNPCTGFEAACFVRTILKELQALGF